MGRLSCIIWVASKSNYTVQIRERQREITLRKRGDNVLTETGTGMMQTQFKEHLQPPCPLKKLNNYSKGRKTICLQCRRPWFDSWVGKIRWRGERLPTPVFWPGEFHGLCHPRDHKESDMTEQLSLSLRRATGACDPCSALVSALKLYQWSLICYSISF